MPKRPKRGVSKQAAFLAAFALTAHITKAAKAAKIDRSLHYQWLKEDPAYPELFEAATQEAAQTLEDEAVRRAHEGIDEPLVYQGEFTYKTRDVVLCTLPDGREIDEKKLPEELQGVEIVGRRTVKEKYGAPLAIRKYSDRLLEFLLKGFRPEKYRDRGSVEVTGKDGGPVENAITVTFVKPPAA